MELDMSDLSAVIIGFYDGILQLKKGASAKLFIPSTLAYGTAGMGASIKPNDILMFEIKVLTVKELK